MKSSQFVGAVAAIAKAEQHDAVTGDASNYLEGIVRPLLPGEAAWPISDLRDAPIDGLRAAGSTVQDHVWRNEER